MKKFMLVTRLDMDKYEGQSSFNLAWVKEFILEQNLILFITPQRERIVTDREVQEADAGSYQ